MGQPLKLSGKMREIPFSDEDMYNHDILQFSIHINEFRYFRRTEMINTVEELEQFKKEVIAYVNSLKLRQISNWNPAG